VLPSVKRTSVSSFSSSLTRLSIKALELANKSKNCFYYSFPTTDILDCMVPLLYCTEALDGLIASPSGLS